MSHKKNTDPEGSMEELIAHAMETAKAPFNSDRKPSLPSLKSCAAAVRIKKECYETLSNIRKLQPQLE